MEDKISILTEASDEQFHFTRTAIFSFLETNKWFDGTIYLAIPPGTSLSARNIKLLHSIYNNIEFAPILENPIIQHLEKYKNAINYSKMIWAALKTTSFCFESNKILYFSNTSLFLNNITHLLIEDSLISPLENNYIFYNGTNKNSLIISSILEKFESESFLSNEDLENSLNLEIANFSKYPENTANYRASVQFSDARFNTLKPILMRLNYIHYNLILISKSEYSKINSIWLQKNQALFNWLNSPKNRSPLNLKSISINKPSKKLIKEVLPIPNLTINESDYNISVIIPAFKAELYIEECIQSIINQTAKSKIEILIGIDGCTSTKNKILELMEKYEIRVYYNESSPVGPYIIRNSLLNRAKYDNILFFDADDIMSPELISNILKYYNQTSIIRFKYFNFNDTTNYKLTSKPHTDIAHGVFFSPKSSIDLIGGFQPWLCGADTEFIKRCKVNKINEIRLPHYLFYRRIHSLSLTQNERTNSHSKVRKEAKHFINTNKNWSIPITRKTTNLIKL